MKLSEPHCLFPYINEKAVPQFRMELQWALNRQNNIEKERHVGGLVNKPSFQNLQSKTVWSLPSDTDKDQWSRTERPEIHPKVCGPLILDKAFRGEGAFF